MSRLLSVCVALLLATPSAFAAKGSDKTLVDDIKQLTASGEYERALAEIEKGLSNDPKNLDLYTARRDVYLELEQYEKAYEACKEHLSAGAKGASKTSTKKIMATLETLLGTKLTVNVTNGPAKVYLTSRTKPPLCATPDCVDRVVQPKKHKVIVEREGFELFTQSVNVELASTQVLNVTLVELPAEVKVSSNPADATFTLDGNPFTNGTKVPPGEHTLVATAPGHAPSTQKVTSALGKPVQVSFALSRLLRVTSLPEGASLQLNGKPAQVTDGAIVVPPGVSEIRLEATAAGYEPKGVTVPADLPPGAELAVPLRRFGGFLSVKGAPDGALLFVDGEQKGTLPLSAPLEIPAGSHAVEVRAEGKLPFQKTAEFKENTPIAVNIDKMRTAGKSKMKISFGAAGGLAVGSAVFGVLALRNESAFNERRGLAGVDSTRVNSAGEPVSNAKDCEKGVSFVDSELQSLRASGCRNSLVSDVMLGAAAVGAGVGAFFLVTEGKGTSPGEITLAPRLTPNGFALAGRF